MSRSKVLTAAAISSSLVLVACGGNVDDTDSGSMETTEPTTLTLEEEPVVIEAGEEAVPETVIEIVDESAAMVEETLVYFDFDKSDIRSEFRDMLDATAEYLIANPNQMVVLEGHADERGTREYNLGLGEDRAEQVATYLQVKGVSAAQLDTVSYGEEKPAVVGKTEAEYSLNRRVEIVYK